MRQLAGICVLLAVSGGANAAGADPFAGTWLLEPALSRYEAGDKPASMVIVMGETPEGLQYQSCTRYAAGRVSYAEYTARYDGRPVMVTGKAGVMLPVALRLANADTVVATYMRGFEVLATSERRLDDQGARMTITTTSRQPDGASPANVGVYRRQPGGATLTPESCRP